MSANPDPGHAPLDVIAPEPEQKIEIGAGLPTVMAGSISVGGRSIFDVAPKKKRWIVAKRSDNDLEVIEAVGMRIHDGCLIFVDSDVEYVRSNITLALAPGTWRSVVPEVTE